MKSIVSFTATILLLLCSILPAWAESGETTQLQNQKIEARSDAVHALKAQLETKDLLPAVTSFETSESSGISLVRLFQGLAFCLAVFLGGIHFYKKYVLKDQGQITRSMRLIERLSLTPKTSLLLVEVEKKKILVGLSPEGLQFLNDHEFLNPSAYYDLPATQAEAAFPDIEDNKTEKAAQCKVN